MKLPLFTALTLSMASAAPSAMALPALPEESGLIPRTGTFYVNSRLAPGDAAWNNGFSESIGIAIANNGNLIIGWEDDGFDLTDYQGVWTLFDSAGVGLIPDTAITSEADGLSISSRFLSFFRADGSPIPGNEAWGPKVKANLFGDGIGFGATAFAIGLDIPELIDINFEDGGDVGEFPVVQLFNSEGTKLSSAIPGYTDADSNPAGGVQIGDWDFLSDGNVVIVSQSLQLGDLSARFGGASQGEHVTFRIVRPDGSEVRGLSLVSSQPVKSVIRHGVGVTRNGFAVRYEIGGVAKLRFFKNDGTALTGDVDLATLAGIPQFAAGGRGEAVGFHGNGMDAYALTLVATDPATHLPHPYVAVINADGSLRFATGAGFESVTALEHADVAISGDGRTAVFFANSDSMPGSIQGRLFSRDGTPVGKIFAVSEKEEVGIAVEESSHPRVAWRGNSLAVAWESRNSPDESTKLIGARVFDVGVGDIVAGGLKAKSGTVYLNPPSSGQDASLNNQQTESLGVAIAGDGSVLVGWEDDGDGLTDYQGVWTLLDSSARSITPLSTLNSLDTQASIDSSFLSFFRTDGTPTPGNTAWGPKIQANLFGNGLGMGATAFWLGSEVPELLDVNIQADGHPADFPVVQLLNNDGSPLGTPIPGYLDLDADPTGNVRIGDWDFLSDGNIVIVSESRQAGDLVDRFGGSAAGTHVTYRIVRPDGTEVKSLALVSDAPVAGEIWHGVGVTAHGFAVRYSRAGIPSVRLFQNDGTPITPDIALSALGGDPAYGEGGRGDGAGFHGNGLDAYVAVCSSVDPQTLIAHPYLMVINADGTLRYARSVTTDHPTVKSEGVDASITPDGRVIVTWADSSATDVGGKIVEARLFASDGQPLSGVFAVSELETPASALLESSDPRVAWRGDEIAVALGQQELTRHPGSSRGSSGPAGTRWSENHRPPRRR